MSRLEEINKSLTPYHVAIIMDGNGRWAQAQGRERAFGHLRGIDTVREVVNAAAQAGVKVLTLYTFSEENWSRPKEEVDALMSMLVSAINDEVEDLNKNGVKLMAIGSINKLPKAARETLASAIDRTSKNERISLVLALSYSGRMEITHAMREIATEMTKGALTPSDITETLISSHLYTNNLPDPDLLIRTGGEKRISNFLLWQCAYTELYFSDTYWPDFKAESLYDALLDFQRRQRRFGKTGEQVTEK